MQVSTVRGKVYLSSDETGDNSDQIAVTEVQSLKVSSRDSRGTNYILTQAPVEQIVGFLTKYFSNKRTAITQDTKYPGKFSFTKEERDMDDDCEGDSDDEDEGQEAAEPEVVHSCSIQVRILQAEENELVKVIQFKRKSGDSLLFLREFSNFQSMLTA